MRLWLTCPGLTVGQFLGQKFEVRATQECNNVTPVPEEVMMTADPPRRTVDTVNVRCCLSALIECLCTVF